MAREKRRSSHIIEEETYGKAGIDVHFLLIVILLLLTGLVAMFTSSHASAYYRFGDSYYFVRSQFFYALLGLAAMAAIAFFCTPKLLKKITPIGYVVSLGLLFLVPFIGTVKNGAKRWIDIGPISIQPSEIAKIALVLTLSVYISKYQNKMKSFKYGIVNIILILAPVVFGIVIEKHVSATLIVCAITAVMMFAGGVSFKYFALAGVGGGLGAAALIMFSPHALNRVKVWIDPFIDPQGKGFQSIQSLYAIGSGGVFGLGLGQSRQKYLYIPEPQNDFIFSIWAEELGFVGAVLVILLFSLLIWRGFLIALRSPDKFSSLVVMGLTAKLALQAILNIGVVTNTIPNTGISLPFFSYGGTALIMQLCEMGVILAISKYTRIVKG